MRPAPRDAAISGARLLRDSGDPLQESLDAGRRHAQRYPTAVASANVPRDPVAFRRSIVSYVRGSARPPSAPCLSGAAVGLTFHPERRRNPKVTHPLPIPDYATPETRAEIESHNAANRDIESDLAAVRQRQEVADQADPRNSEPRRAGGQGEAIAAARKKLLASKIAMLQARLSLLGRLEAERLAGEQAAGPAIGTAREAARTALRAAGYGRYFGDSNPNVKGKPRVGLIWPKTC